MLSMIAISILPLVFRDQYPVFTAFDYVSTIAFIVDYIIRWSTADLLLKRGFKSFLIYPFTPMAIIDLLSILPGLNVLDRSFKLFRLTRIFRLFRVLRIFRYSHKIESFLSILKKQKDILLSVLVLAIVYIFARSDPAVSYTPAGQYGYAFRENGVLSKRQCEEAGAGSTKDRGTPCFLAQ